MNTVLCVALLGATVYSQQATAQVNAATVCDVLRNPDEKSGKVVTIIGYLDGGMQHGFALTDEGGYAPCPHGGIPGFRWPGALAVDILSGLPDTFGKLLDSHGIIMRRKVRVEAVVEARPWRWTFCPAESFCFSNGFYGQFAARIRLKSLRPEV